MRDECKNWTYDEFLTFLLIYAASADLVITDKEKKLITTSIEGVDYDEVFEFFEECSDYDRLQVILSFKDSFFPTEEDKGKLLKDMERVFHIDKDFDVSEQNMLRAIRRIL